MLTRPRWSLLDWSRVLFNSLRETSMRFINVWSFSRSPDTTRFRSASEEEEEEEEEEEPLANSV